jgi:hypothetical protein
MFCPSCGTEERETNQFCRGCGSNLRIVRSALEKPDSITASAANARDEIGRAVAQKIRETQSTKELKKVAEDVLPEIEKFLESPEERRMRRVRLGSLLTFIGLGAAIAFSIVAAVGKDKDTIFVAGAGFVTFCIGLSFIVNGLYFTVPKKVLADNASEGEAQRQLDYLAPNTNELKLPEANQVFTSVVDETTQHLKEKEPVLRDKKSTVN